MRGIGAVRRVLFPWGIIGATIFAVLSVVFYRVVCKMNGENHSVYFVGSFGGSAIMLFTVPAIILLSGTVITGLVGSSPLLTL